MGSISHRYGATPRSCYHCAIVKASSNAKYSVEMAILPTSSAHCSSFSRQNFTKISVSLAQQRSCRTQSTSRKSDDTVPSKRRPKYAKKPKNAKFQAPISPTNGGRFPPNKNHFSHGRQGCKRQWSIWGVWAQNPKMPHPPNFAPHCSNSTNLIFAKFSASLEHPSGCRTPSKNRKSVDRVPSKSRPKFAKMPNFKPPHFPQIGADSPELKTIFLTITRAIRAMGTMGGAGPQRG